MKNIKCEDCCFCKTGKKIDLVMKHSDKDKEMTFNSIPMPFCTLAFNWMPARLDGKSAVVECTEFKAKRL